MKNGIKNKGRFKAYYTSSNVKYLNKNIKNQKINLQLESAKNCSITLMAIWSVLCKSAGSPEAQTHRKGPKPKEKMSLKFVEYFLALFHLPKNILHIAGKNECFSIIVGTFRQNVGTCPMTFHQKCIPIVPKMHSTFGKFLNGRNMANKAKYLFLFYFKKLILGPFFDSFSKFLRIFGHKFICLLKWHSNWIISPIEGIMAWSLVGAQFHQ
jgi:hypothetical protein